MSYKDLVTHAMGGLEGASMEDSGWHESFSVGLAALDDDHHLLLGAVARLRRALGADEEALVVSSVLSFLTNYTAYHFEREERVMQACGYEDLKAHRSQHRRLTDKIACLQARQTDPAAIVELLDYLDRWLEVHFRTEDQKYQPLIEAKHDVAERVSREILPLRYWLRQDNAPEHKEVDLSHLRVLITAQNASLRWLLRSALAQMGIHRIIGASNREAALVAVRQEPLDLLLVRAYDLSEEDLSFVRTVREMPVGPGGRRQLMVLHHSRDPRRKSRALQEGATGLLDLPLSVPHLVASVVRLTEATT